VVAVPSPTGLARTSKLRPAYCSGYCRASTIVTWATSSRGILRESVPVVSSSMPTTNSCPGHWSSSRMDNGILDLFCSSGSLFHQVDLRFALPLDYHSTRCSSSAHGGTDHQHMRSRRAGIDLILLSSHPIHDHFRISIWKEKIMGRPLSGFTSAEGTGLADVQMQKAKNNNTS
jgi:hypothetical protein